MTIVPTGRFVIGSPDAETTADSGIRAAKPQRTVNIRHVLAVAIHAVTVDQFAAFVAETAHNAGNKAKLVSDSGRGSAPVVGANWENPGFLQSGSQPVTCVNWCDAQAYLSWLNARTNLCGESDAYRLLSESEWEYVCRANPNGKAHEPLFSFGDTLSTDQANFDGTRETSLGPKGIFRAATTCVGSFQANAFGLFDLHGNVWEWCQDPQTNSYSSLPRDGNAQRTTDLPKTIPDSRVGRVIRGGSWVNDASVLQSAYRSRADSDERTNYLGFRVARTMR